MTTKIEEILINRGNKDKRADNFYIEFFNLESNISNFLGRQVKQISRPQLQMATSKHTHKRAEYTSPEQVRFTGVNVTFADDEEGITAMILYAQMMRQQHKHDSVVDEWLGNEGSFKNQRFGVRYGIYNSRGEKTESYILEDCLITEITHDDLIQASGENRNTIQVGIEFDNLQLNIFDRFLDLLSGRFDSRL